MRHDIPKRSFWLGILLEEVGRIVFLEFIVQAQGECGRPFPIRKEGEIVGLIFERIEPRSNGKVIGTVPYGWRSAD